MIYKLKAVFTVLLLFFLYQVQAQDRLDVDSLFKEARTAAFDQKNYPQAIKLCKEALAIAPDYTEIKVFLGGVYSWSKKTDSAGSILQSVLEDHPDNEAAASALTDLAYWNGQNGEALQYSNQGLKYHPHSTGLLVKKVKILNALEQYGRAQKTADTLLKYDPKNTEVGQLLNVIRDKTSLNKIGVSYHYVYFDKQFPDPWHIVSLDYTRQTAVGDLITRINFANRFAKNGLQGEVDFYPHISKTFYAYLNTGISGTNSVFPHYRAGASLYANIPWEMEIEGGFRYMKFSSDVWIYTASIGKYFKNFWFNFRTYLVPDQDNSQSYNLTLRYYTGGKDDYYALAYGTGISPDDRTDAALLGIKNKLNAQRVSARYSHVFHELNIIRFDLTWYYKEFLPKVYGNQWDIGIAYQRRF